MKKEVSSYLFQLKLYFETKLECSVTRSNWLKDQALPTDDLLGLNSKKCEAQIAILYERNEDLKIGIKELETKNEKLRRGSRYFWETAHELGHLSSKVRLTFLISFVAQKVSYSRIGNSQ